MNSKRKAIDYWLIALLVTVLVSAMAAAIWGTLELAERQERLTEHFLQNNEQAVHARSEGQFLEIQGDLEAEAEAFAGLDSLDMRPIIGRWRSLLRSNRMITAIRLADELGNEIALNGTPTGLVQMATNNGSREGPPIGLFLANMDTSGLLDSVWLHNESYDPRRKAWYGRALEDSTGEPVWTLGTAADSTRSLQISFLIRSPERHAPFHIMMFDVALAPSRWLDTRTLAGGRLNGILFDADARIFGRTRSTEFDADEQELSAMLAAVMAGNTEDLAPVKVRGHRYVGKVSQHPLNGLMLYTLVLVDADVAEPWVRVERIALWSMVGLLIFIVVLLTWLLIRRLQGNERIRQHAKRSRSLERKLTKTIGERDVLNREVHHRVKNNLQVVSSLLNLQASRLEHGPVREEFLRGKRRIDTIALVHHKMYDLKDLRNVDLQQFFNQLITSLAVMHLPNSRTVSHELKAGGIKADQDTAIELGIILCELVTNTYQHAFPYATGGHVDILVQPVESDLHRLIVKDNGRGLPANYNNGEGKLGLEIVDALAEQLNGSFHVRTEGGGVTFEVLFRMKWNTSAGDIIDPQGAE
jgi:two-component sensor histidine kinase